MPFWTLFRMIEQFWCRKYARVCQRDHCQYAFLIVFLVFPIFPARWMRRCRVICQNSWWWLLGYKTLACICIRTRTLAASTMCYRMANCTSTMLGQPMLSKRIRVALSIGWQVIEASKINFPWNRNSVIRERMTEVLMMKLNHHFLCFNIASMYNGMERRWHPSIDVSRTNHCEWAQRLSAAPHECREAFVAPRCVEWANYVVVHSAGASRAHVSVSRSFFANEWINSAEIAICDLIAVAWNKESKTKNQFSIFVFRFSLSLSRPPDSPSFWFVNFHTSVIMRCVAVITYFVRTKAGSKKKMNN